MDVYGAADFQVGNSPKQYNDFPIGEYVVPIL